ncbi:excalibur calcium-binding domain-containing protein [Roseobacter sp. GAI101]|uniref:excalibur calcium-binding domain-containing protein n=1 Tax=Roseobacter sp. (strain GAI101) TaxID=391589 RepID=UPI000A0373CC|nr:excalibur calcium-binding domain-containing protein [Roseobacter sp. GAI101]
MRLSFLIVIGATLAGCAGGTVNNAASDQRMMAFAQALQKAPTASVCATYIQPSSSAKVKLMTEAELAARGAKQCSGSNIGKQSAALYRRSQFTRSVTASTLTAGSDKDCGDFASGALAQRFFLASGGPSQDPHNLDGDGDGLACEWGAQATRLSTLRLAPPRKARSTARRSSSSRCYTGPRGGTYTITASGNKNYNGC